MNIFISNLSDRITNESLRAIFATYGKVASSIVFINRFGNISKGVAFIVMPVTNEGTTAIVKLHGSILDGSRVRVKQSTFLRQKLYSFFYRK